MYTYKTTDESVEISSISDFVAGKGSHTLKTIAYSYENWLNEK